MAPTLSNVAITPEIDEGEFATLSGDISDPDLENAFELIVDWGEGTSETISLAAGTTSFSVTHQYLDDALTLMASDIYTVTATLSRELGETNSHSTSVTVNNVAPTLTIDTDAVVINEGSSANKSISASDVPADTVSIDASLGTISINPVGGWIWSYFGDDDLAKEILKGLEPFETLGEPPFSAVLVPEGGQFLRSLVPLLPFFEVDPLKVQFLGTGLWYDPTLPGEPTLEGAWFAGPDPAKVEDFMARFEGLYGYRPPRIVTLSYDAISLVATLARIEFKKARFSGKTLQNANGFEGLDGIFRFRGDGTAERRFAILEIRKEGFFVVSPAPSSFQEIP
ncbi:MAG: hypothetical protein IH901_05310 [Proteobacteria bacterium]|nr:hypothetical protein [Pseudomonadota bacterium]